MKSDGGKWVVAKFESATKQVTSTEFYQSNSKSIKHFTVAALLVTASPFSVPANLAIAAVGAACIEKTSGEPKDIAMTEKQMLQLTKQATEYADASMNTDKVSQFLGQDGNADKAQEFRSELISLHTTSLREALKYQADNEGAGMLKIHSEMGVETGKKNLSGSALEMLSEKVNEVKSQLNEDYQQYLEDRIAKDINTVIGSYPASSQEQ